MSQTFFLTGANAKIKLNGLTVAFATDIAYTIDVKHAAPRLLGMYEPSSVEPLSYDVSGNFTVIRYIKGMAGAVAQVPDSVSPQGNGIGNYTIAPKNFNENTRVDEVLKKTGSPANINDGRADLSFDPKSLDVAFRFDIEIYQKYQDIGSNTPQLKRVAIIRDCRLTRSDFQLTKRSTAIQRFTFMGIYVDEDSFSTGMSGVGQQFV
jgi:hypothetical protein